MPTCKVNRSQFLEVHTADTLSIHCLLVRHKILIKFSLPIYEVDNNLADRLQ